MKLLKMDAIGRVGGARTKRGGDHGRRLGQDFETGSGFVAFDHRDLETERGALFTGFLSELLAGAAAVNPEVLKLV
jgi:hypothetical protein